MKKSTVAVAAIEQHGALRQRLHDTELRRPLDLLVGQPGEGLGPALIGIGRIDGRRRRALGDGLRTHLRTPYHKSEARSAGVLPAGGKMNGSTK